MAELQVTLETSVTEDQIDHLGHMNVRFYGRNAQAGTRELLGRLGIDETRSLRVDDVYTRHLHEQLLGAPLEVRSGVLGVDEAGIRMYHELANQADGAIAATFVHRAVPRPGATVDLAALADAARSATIAVPAHGATRSISLDHDPVAGAPSLDVVRERGLAMRLPRSVSAEECNADGTYITEFAPMLVWAGESPDGSRGDDLIDGPNGEKMAWASMETRMSVVRLPRLGDRVQAFGALVELRDKTMQRVQWAYDLDRGEVLTVFESVSLAFDTVARRPMSIPDSIRRREGGEPQPDLVGRAAS